MPSTEKERRKPKKKGPEKKKNKFTELFKEEEEQEARRKKEEEGGIYDESEGEEGKKGIEESEETKGIALFDLDLYGRRSEGPRESEHAAGFGKRKSKRPPGFEEEDEDEDEEEEEKGEGGSSEEEGSEEEEELEDALFDEWDMLALERARRAVDDGYGYFWDSLEGSKAPKSGSSDPMLLPRVWESSFFLTAFQNIETKPQFFFYVITFGHINKNRKMTGALRRRILYSPGFHLRSGEYKPLHAPLPIWPHKTLPISYGELGNYCINIDMWLISDYTFNTLYASTQLTLREIVDMDPDVTIMLQRSRPGKKKKSYEVQRIKASIQISEVFDFDFFFESWTFTPGKNILPYITDQLKMMKFILPRGSGNGWKIRWTDAQLGLFWPAPFTFVYRGTLQQLQNAFFIVKVFVKSSDGWFSRPALIGTALMSLRSVATYPLFKSMVKQVTTEEIRFNQGEIMGNIRCFMRSTGLPYYEDPSAVKRPEQPLAGAALVTQLDLKEQFLVIRLFKCENLPATNSDAGTSDPVVKVMWDGMTNSTVVKPETLRPVYNQNLYFPIRLLDPAERKDPIYIKNCLPLDLLSKGSVVFEVWDKDETSSDFLGGCEMHLSDLLLKGKKLTRILAEGLGAGDTGSSRLPDGRPSAFQYQGEDQPETQVDILDSGAPGTVQPFQVPHVTSVFVGNGIELTGATIQTSVVNRPLIFYEAFVIPPLPEELELLPPRPIKEEQDVWKQLTKRWERDFSKWIRIYMEWFPLAPVPRRFLCTAEHPQTRHLYPLPAFITPVAVPEQIQEEGELLHWISNMTFLYSSKQMRTGQLPRWLSPNYFLITRKGGINDHAVLLCSCLLGLDYDAYVCKGTINDGRDEHCWVMSRHADGWVVFWELTNKKRYHLPARWGYPITNQLPSPPQGSKPDISKKENSYYDGDYLSSWLTEAAAQCGITLEEPAIETAELAEIHGEDVVPDIVLTAADIQLEAWDNLEKSGGRKKALREEATDFDQMRQWMENQINVIPIAPKKALLDQESTLAYVPYSTIEVVFNNQQLWGNLQNHHPACITYDVEDEWLWRSFLTEKPRAIDNTIFVAPSTRDKACEVLQDEIQADIAENIRVYRGRRGLQSQLDHGEAKAERLDKYLELLEFRMRLDPDFDPGPPPGHEAWSAWGVYESVENTQDYSTEWYSHLSKDPAQLSLYGADQGQEYTQQEGDLLEKEYLDISKPPEAPTEDSYQPQIITTTIKTEGLDTYSQAQGQGYSQQQQEYGQQEYGQQMGGQLFTQTPVHGVAAEFHHSSSSDSSRKCSRSGSENPAVVPSVTNDSLFSREDSPPTSESAQGSSVLVSVRSPDEVIIPKPTLCRAISRKVSPSSTPVEVLLTPATFSSGTVPNRRTRWEGFSESSSDEAQPDLNESDSDPEHDTASILEYCKRQKIQLATPILPTPISPPISPPKTSLSFATHPLFSPSDPPQPEVLNPQPIHICPPQSPLFPPPVVQAIFDEELSSESTPTGSSLSQSSYHSSPQNVTLPSGLQQTIVTETQCTQPPPSPECATSSSHLHDSFHSFESLLGPPDRGQPDHMFLAVGPSTEFESQEPSDTIEKKLSQDTTDLEPSSVKPAEFPQRISYSVRNTNPEEGLSRRRDTLWEEFESVFHEAFARFCPSIEHGMMMDDYEAFEERRRAAATQGPPPTQSSGQQQYAKPYAASPTAQQPKVSDKDETFFKVLQRPVAEKTTEDRGGLDISEMGFSRDEPLKERRRQGAIQMPRKKEIGEKAPEETPAVDASKLSATGEVEGPQPPAIYYRPILSSDYPQNQTAKWNYYYRMEGLYYQWQKARFPVKPSHTFCGFPMHFSTTDTAHIRGFLLSSRRFRKVMEIPVDGITFVIRSKVFALMGGVVSVWTFIGCEIHWAGKRERQTRMKRAPKKKKRNRR